jgi:hypothetical protein
MASNLADRGIRPRSTILMTRSILCGLLAVLSVGALGVVPLACQSGGVTPEDEYDPTFASFHVDLANIESRSFQCSTRICLVNHFQGRVSCPLGQPGAGSPGATIVTCTGPGAACAEGTCESSDVYAPTCTSNTTCAAGDTSCVNCPNGLTCNTSAGVCTCTAPTMVNGQQYACETAPNCTGSNCLRVLQSFYCHKTGNCQLPGNTDAENNGKDCCVPGGDVPIGVTVCGQCGAMSKRNAAQAVYCSCRCCAPCCPSTVTTAAQAIAQGCSQDMSTCGDKCDPNFNYCSCPSGYACTDIREYVGLGDQNLAGAYCVAAGTEWNGTTQCGADTMAFTNDSSCVP